MQHVATIKNADFIIFYISLLFCKSTACFHLPQSKRYGDIDFLMEFYTKDSNTIYLYTIFHIQTYFCTYIELK
ncbi:hypothetical protein DW985_01465 [Bacteroides ovatus]|nr:hypothetical protein F3F42_13795 [Bacteroides ovatus]KAA3919316.1 hypothetical protein F3D73_03545 [Bacteroides ovatus]KAA3967117.1 hypothetical protein F3F61_26540 [Bacteroides ovatus]RGZ63235.1 hypothetical protein DW985_01465 [Bacteroides ovatus]RHD29986.1 hypothetical protein DW803_06250 [Bacteroides ovatus]